MAAKQDPGLRSNAPARPDDPIDLDSSVAGEEDPGASIDLANVRPRGTEGRSDQPAGQGAKQPSGGQAAMAPGDEAPAGTPSTGEDVCPECGGTGKLGASKCPNCLGTGVVIVGIGGA
jgi:hypothetical protein